MNIQTQNNKWSITQITVVEGNLTHDKLCKVRHQAMQSKTSRRKKCSRQLITIPHLQSKFATF